MNFIVKHHARGFATNAAPTAIAAVNTAPEEHAVDCHVQTREEAISAIEGLLVGAELSRLSLAQLQLDLGPRRYLLWGERTWRVRLWFARGEMPSPEVVKRLRLMAAASHHEIKLAKTSRGAESMLRLTEFEYALACATLRCWY